MEIMNMENPIPTEERTAKRGEEEELGWGNIGTRVRKMAGEKKTYERIVILVTKMKIMES